jgi:hypothetical protein
MKSATMAWLSRRAAAAWEWLRLVVSEVHADFMNLASVLTSAEPLP